MPNDFDNAIVDEVIAGRIVFIRLRRRHRRGIDRLVSAGWLDVWLRPDYTVVTLTPWAAEQRSVEIDEDQHDDGGQMRELPAWRRSAKISDHGPDPCWAHEILIPKEVGFFALRHPELIPDHRERDPSDVAEPKPVTTELDQVITVGSVPAYADIDVRKWLKAKKLNRIRDKKAKKADKVRLGRAG